MFKGRKILGLHIRLGDYLKEPHNEYHGITSLNYYKKALIEFNDNYEDYDIIVFSDDYSEANKRLSELNMDYTCANKISSSDEEDFLLLCLCDYKICTNSSFSLMSCFFNDYLNLKKSINTYFLKMV